MSGLRRFMLAVVTATALAVAGNPGRVLAADGDIEAGRAKFVLCASCHGSDGRSGVVPEYPRLAGQSRKYLVNALKAYQSGRRTGTYAALMAETAKALSDADIDNLAAYLATLED